METRAIDFLRRLLDSPGPSGYEQPPSRVWRAEAETFADETEVDLIGNSYARLRKAGAPVVVVEGHIDEIGFIVTYIDDDGFIWFEAIGGWDAPVVIGQRIRIASRNGDVQGVIGRKAAHLIKAEDRRNIELKDLWIDIGAKDRADATARVAVGDAAVVDASFLQLSDDLVVSRSLDNRVGAFVALETLRLLAEDRPAVEVVALAATQEEIGLHGAAVANVRLAPLVAIALDVTHATDYPGANRKADNDVKLGGGPVLTRGASINPVVYDGLSAAAERLGLTCPVQAAGRNSGTDADAMRRTGRGAATGLVSLPNRYMHSPNEVVSLSDLENAARLIAEFIRTITPESDFRPM